jgi:hypothetical protein
MYEGMVRDDELDKVPKDTMARDKKNERVKLMFVQGIVITLPGFFAFSPVDAKKA